MSYGKKNVIKIDPLKYSLCLLGESKSGKTHLIYDYCEKLAGPNGYLFLETGSERGADAISGINYINCPEWNMDYDEETNSAGFADVCDDIIDNKATDYPDLRVVVWDTYDHLIEIAEQESIRLYNKEAKEQGKPTVKSINQSWGGFGRGEKKAMELMFGYRDRLLQVGVQTIVIGHVRKKDISDPITGEQYQVITSDQQQNYFNALKKDLHFLALLYIDRDIVKESSGKKDAKGHDIKINKLMGESRRIKFRDDNYAIDSGSRFADIVPEVPCDVNDFIKAITDAIKAEASKGSVPVEKLEAEQKAEDKRFEQKVAAKEEANNEVKELDSIRTQIKDFCVANKTTNKEAIMKLMSEAKSLGLKNPLEVDNLDDAKKLLALCA